MMALAATKCSGCDEDRPLGELRVAEVQALEAVGYEMQQQALCGQCFGTARWEAKYFGYAFRELALV